jgi:hypothetical protein
MFNHSQDEIIGAVDAFLPLAQKYAFNEIEITVDLPFENKTTTYIVTYSKININGTIGWDGSTVNIIQE